METGPTPRATVGGRGPAGWWARVGPGATGLEVSVWLWVKLVKGMLTGWGQGDVRG